MPLVAANNTTINTYGNCRRVVDVGLKRDYAWTFIAADVKQPITGADFLIHYSLLVDLKSRCLRDMRTGLAIPVTLSSIKVDTVQKGYTKLLGHFPELSQLTHSRRQSQYIHVSVDGIFLKVYFLCRHITQVISGSVLYSRISLPEIYRAPSGMR